MRRSPVRRDALGQAADLGRLDRRPRTKSGMAREKGLGLLLRPPPARASRCNRPGGRQAAARPAALSSSRAAGRRACRGPPRPWSRRRRVAADRAGGRAGRVEQDGVEGLLVELLGASTARVSAESLSRARFSSAAEPLRRTVDRQRPRRPAAASCAVLPPGAAQRSAMRSPGLGRSRRAGKAAAASCTHQAPSSIAGQVADRRRARRSRTLPVGSRTPPSRSAQPAAILLHRQVDGGGRAMRLGDGGGDVGAVLARSSGPASQSGVSSKGSALREDRIALPGDAAQHGVDEAARMPSVRSSLREPHGGVDGGMVGHVEEQDLRRADGEEAQAGARPRLALVERARAGRCRMVPRRRKVTTAMARASASSRGDRVSARRQARPSRRRAATRRFSVSATASQARRRGPSPSARASVGLTATALNPRVRGACARPHGLGRGRPREARTRRGRRPGPSPGRAPAGRRSGFRSPGGSRKGCPCRVRTEG